MIHHKLFQLGYTAQPNFWPLNKNESALSHIWGSTPDDAGERLNGIQEVSGSIPLISTIGNRKKARFDE